VEEMSQEVEEHARGGLGRYSRSNRRLEEYDMMLLVEILHLKAKLAAGALRRPQKASKEPDWLETDDYSKLP
jgi:hypothetical protein